jgi:plasmid stabilization system protein ParE
MSRKYEVRAISRANKMFSAHVEFLNQASPRAAVRLVLSFEKILAALAENPFQFPFANDQDAHGIPPKKYRKCLFEKRYKAIFHIINDNEVIVAAVMDCRTENKGHFADDAL